MYKNADHSQEQGTTKMTPNGRMDPVWHSHTMEISQQCKQTDSIRCINLNEPCRHTVAQKKKKKGRYKTVQCIGCYFYTFQKQAKQSLVSPLGG